MHVPSEHQKIVGLEFAGDGRRLIVARPRGIVQVWNIDDGREQMAISGRSELEYAAISPDGRSMAWGGDDAIVRVWDITVEKTGQESTP
jgi:WD40 repeat protein